MTKTQIRELLEPAGLRLKKRFGQHFLIDGNLLTKLVQSAGIGPNDVVLEVGAGLGNLTELLVEQAGHVVAVEIDGGLFKQLSMRLGDHQRLTLLHADILENKSHVSPLVLEQVACAANAQPAELLMVSNLPYSVASPLIVALLCCDLPFSRFVFSVQAEVADRMLANEGSRDFGPLSIVLQSTCSLEKLFHLPPQVFWPAPEVDSVVLRLDINRANFASPDDLRAFGEFVRAAFGHRRKTLNYNLSRTVDPPVLRSLGESLEIDLRQRPEQIPVRKWLEMYFRLNLKSRES